MLGYDVALSRDSIQRTDVRNHEESLVRTVDSLSELDVVAIIQALARSSVRPARGGASQRGSGTLSAEICIQIMRYPGVLVHTRSLFNDGPTPHVDPRRPRFALDQWHVFGNDTRLRDCNDE